MQKDCTGHLQIAILLPFLAIEPHFVRKGCAGDTKSQFYPSFGDRTPFRAKGLRQEPGNRNLTSVFGDRTSFRAKGFAGRYANCNLTRSFWRSNLISCQRVRRTLCKLHFYFSFWRSNLISCQGSPDALQIAILLPFLVIELNFVRKGLRRTPTNRNFTADFGDRTSCRAKGLRFVPSRWHCPAPSREKYKRRREQARGQKNKRARENVKMWRWEDVRMWG